MRRQRIAAGVAALAALAAATTACSGSGSSGSDGASGGTLTVVSAGAPASLNPAKANVGSDNWFVNLAYDTVLRLGPGGKTTAGLATKWGYVGTGNKTFDFTLRPNLKFADGTRWTPRPSQPPSTTPGRTASTSPGPRPSARSPPPDP